MSQTKDSLSANQAWAALLEKYPIREEIGQKGYFRIKASQIKEFREPRLMAKWDSSDALPEVLQKNRINLLPDSRSSYVLGNFLLYQPIPELEEPVTRMSRIRLPEFETIDAENIGSEANAIHVLVLSGILDEFLGTRGSAATFNGRMGTGEFDFRVDTCSGAPQWIHVRHAQCEIDGGFENEDCVVILEAKNVVHGDFHIRQLYYPYRLWSTRVKKPIRLVFCVYSNQIYRLFEYRFRILEDYSSIELVRSRNYSLQDTRITLEDLRQVRAATPVVTDDNAQSTRIPFLQANSMARIISLLEHLFETPMTKQQIAALMDFEPRQSDYYFNAGRYLGLFESRREDGQSVVSLTRLGSRVFRLNYRQRQLKLVELMLGHRIFADLFDRALSLGSLPDRGEIGAKMREYQVCGENLVDRRASSVYGWLRWMFQLTKL